MNVVLYADKFESDVKRFEEFIKSLSKYLNGKKPDDLSGRVMELIYATNPLSRESRMLIIVCRRLNEDVERIQREADEFYKKLESNTPSVILHGHFKNDPSLLGATFGLSMKYFETDVYIFYVMLRSHLDSLAHLIRLNHDSWGELETSMHNLLKNRSNLSKHDPAFHGKLVSELSWFYNTKKFRDDLVHRNTYFRPGYDPTNKQIFLDLYKNTDLARLNLIGKYNLGIIQTEVDHLVSLYGFLEDNLKFDWVSGNH